MNRIVTTEPRCTINSVNRFTSLDTQEIWSYTHGIVGLMQGHRTVIKSLLLRLHTLDLLRNFALYTWRSRVGVSTTSMVFKIMI